MLPRWLAIRSRGHDQGWAILAAVRTRIQTWAGAAWSRGITLEIEEVGTELGAATARVGDLERTERSLRITSKLVGETIDEMTGILEDAPLDTRVALARDLFAQIDVDSCEGKAVAVWKAATYQGVSRSDSVSSWLRGLEAVQAEWMLVAAVHNLGKLFRSGRARRTESSLARVCPRGGPAQAIGRRRGSASAITSAGS